MFRNTDILSVWPAGILPACLLQRIQPLCGAYRRQECLRAAQAGKPVPPRRSDVVAWRMCQYLQHVAATAIDRLLSTGAYTLPDTARLLDVA